MECFRIISVARSSWPLAVIDWPSPTGRCHADRQTGALIVVDGCLLPSFWHRRRMPASGKVEGRLSTIRWISWGFCERPVRVFEASQLSPKPTVKIESLQWIKTYPASKVNRARTDTNFMALSPRQFGAVVVEEVTAVGHCQSVEQSLLTRNRLFHRDWCAGATHTGLDPARVQRHRNHTA